MQSLVLHMGMGKTGSSALQVGFVKNRDFLLHHNILYPEHRSDEMARRDGVVSGNGLDLARYLVPRIDGTGLAPETHLASLLTTLREERAETILYSSEFLHQFDEARFRELAHTAKVEGYAVRGVVHVRNIAGHAMSEYSQQLKRSLFTGTFRDFIDPDVPSGKKYYPGFRRWPVWLREILGTDNVTLIHYDSVRKRIFSHFVETALNIGMTDEYDPILRNINRSLTPSEIELMREINKHVSSQRAATRISDTLVSMPPFQKGRPTISIDEERLLQRRFGRVVGWFNEVGLSGGSLAISSEDVEVGQQKDNAVTARETFLIDLLARVREL